MTNKQIQVATFQDFPFSSLMGIQNTINIASSYPVIIFKQLIL